MITLRRIRPTETQLHIALARWLALPMVARRLQCIWWHVDNTHSNPVRAKQLSRMGMMAGVPDFDFTHNDTRRAFIELKREDGRLSEAQAKFAAWCLQRALPHLVIYSDDTEKIISETEWFLLTHKFIL